MTTRCSKRDTTEAHAACLPIATLLMTILTIACSTGCSTPTPAVSETGARVAVAGPDSARAIVRFQPDIADPTDPRFLAQLASRAHVTRIELIRPMSGDAYVMQVSCIDPSRPGAATSCDSALARLNATTGVIHAEPDRREKHQ